MKSLYLPRIIAALALLLAASILISTVSRSVWMDEAMLIKNLVETTKMVAFASPLPFYDQAQPLLVSIYFKLSADLFGYESASLRYSLLGLTVLMMAPAFYMLRRFEWGALVLVVAIIANAYSLGLYFTEIKHYFFEIAGSFMAIYAVWQVEHRKQPYWAIATAALVSLIGFSTLILSAGLMIYALCWMLLHQGLRISWKQGLALASVGVVILIAYLHMKHLTAYQFTNHAVYGADGPAGAIEVLSRALYGAYGLGFLPCAVASAALWLYRPRGFAFQLNLFFTLVAAFVLLGRLSGHYPVVYARHIIWLVPISLVITTFAVITFTPARNSPVFRSLGWLILLMLLVQAAWTTNRYASERSNDYTENNGLYEELASLEPARVLVYPHAEASLEYYTLIKPDLAKHHYTSWQDNRTVLRDPKIKEDDFERSIFWLFDQRPEEDFLLLISHLDMETSAEVPKRRAQALQAGMEMSGCSKETMYSGKEVLLLKLSCEPPARF